MPLLPVPHSPFIQAPQGPGSGQKIRVVSHFSVCIAVYIFVFCLEMTYLPLLSLPSEASTFSRASTSCLSGVRSSCSLPCPGPPGK